jgi:sigma-B regulation protein RsbU (phosphoserine phosphatase)
VFGIHKIDSSRLLFFLVDIAGRGVSAAINAFRLHTLIQQNIIEFSDPELLLEALNAETVDFFAPGEFATAIFALVDNDRRKIRYASAGGCPPIIISNGQAWRGDPATSGPPLGLDERFSYRTVQLDFPDDSALVLHSNALEAHRLSSQTTGPADAADILAQAIKPGQTAKDALSAVLLLDQDDYHDDDLTLIVISNWPAEDGT